MTDENLEFEWGNKRGKGAKNKLAQFYGSFKYDGVDYELHDCVYMWKENETEPYVGKIVRIWESSEVKKVKILWFFKPVEILNWLNDAKVAVNELFLASGEGLGVANVNPLEAIAGKCNVICISKDKRNPQPSEKELQEADYVFYRVFDVKNLALSDKIPGTIAGVDIADIFNQKESQQSTTTATDRTDKLGGNRNENKDMYENIMVTTSRKHHLGEKDGDELDSRRPKKPRVDNGSILSTRKAETSQKLHGSTYGASSSNLFGDKKANMSQNLCSDLVCNSDKVCGIISVGETKGKSKLDSKSNGVDSGFLKGPRSWFKEMSWEEKMKNADQHGTLVLLENLDPSYTSADVQDIILQGFEECCTVKIAYGVANCNSLLGKAYAIFKTKEIAEKVVSKLYKEQLMLSNGRPLIASFQKPYVPGKETLVGHFRIDRLKLQSREKREAVSTSHCSQPNSIEYDYAMEWLLLQEKASGWSKMLHQEQTEEVKKVMAELKTQLTETGFW